MVMGRMVRSLVFVGLPFTAGKEAKITMNRIEMVYTHTLSGCGRAGGEHNHNFQVQFGNPSRGDSQPIQ